MDVASRPYGKSVLDGRPAGSQAESFDSFMQKRIEAARAYVNGDAQPLDQIVAESGMASFFPPNGGSERGAREVSARYDRDAQSFGEGGETDLDVLQSVSTADVAFWTGFQNARVNLRGAPETMTMKLRITELFRRIGGEWKMLHRHADPMADAVKRESGERVPPRQRTSGEARRTM